MKKTLLAAAFLFAGGALLLTGAEFRVQEASIVTKKNDATFRKAASELKLHLEMVGKGKLAPKGKGKYLFVLREGKDPKVGTWTTDKDKTVITGKGLSLTYAVYDFLEKQLDILFFAPNDTVFKAQNPIKLKDRSGKFVDKYDEHYYWSKTHNRVWASRMKCSKFIKWNTAHAFINWWNKFGAERPDIFAMNKKGVRGALSQGSNSNDPAAAKGAANIFLQICYTAPGIEDLLIAEHLKSKRKHLNLNISSNDGIGNFCHCPKCKALDVKRPRIPEWEVLTDRYIHLANRLAKKAQCLAKPLDVHILAYCETEDPPLREKLEKNILVTFCPTDYRLERLKAQMDGWTKAGAKKIRLRPNLPCYFSSQLPIGFEEHGYKYITLAQSYPQLVGVNLDRMEACSQSTFSFPFFVMGKAMLEPNKGFAHWERMYLRAFGAAAPEMQKYFAYWRNNWNKRIKPDYGNILREMPYFNVGRALLLRAAKYYKEEDFNNAEKLLKAALKKKLSPAEKKRIETLVKCNHHSRLIFRACTKKGAARTQATRDLMQFRKANPVLAGDKMSSINTREIRWGDATGMKMAEATAKYDLPIVNTPIFWHFKLDPKDVGRKENWGATPFAKFSKWKEQAATHTYWQGTPRMPFMSKEMKKILASYDGYGWYAKRLQIPVNWKDRKVFLLFGAVDDGCYVYVNGKLLLERHYAIEGRGSESKPFDVDITKSINWKQKKPYVDVVVCVEDKGGAGGIWKRVFLVSQKKK